MTTTIKMSKKVFAIALVAAISISLVGIGISGMLVKVQPNVGEVKVVAETIGGFKVTDQEICKENGKPIVYFFGSDSCPHCRWEHPIISDVASQFSDYISFRDGMNNQDYMSVYQKYGNINSGYVPFLIAGCKYARLGSGEQYDEQQERQYLTAVFCKLINGSSDLCKSPEIADLMSQMP